MGEVATTTAAFRNQFNKAAGALSILRDGSDHNEFQQQYQACLKVQEVIQHYTSKLPRHVAAPLLIELARHLLAVGKLELALHNCYESVIHLDLLRQPDSSAYPVEQRVHDHVQALLGQATCNAGIAQAQDATLQHHETVTAILAALEVCRCSRASTHPIAVVSTLQCNVRSPCPTR